KGHEKGNGTWQNETTVDAGNRVTITTGRDATIAGAQVSGDAVVADIGRDLTIASTQDSDHYNSKQNSVSGGVGYTFGAGTASGSINVSRDKMTSDYDSVQEQSGLFAGSGGFDVTVGKHTQLDGGVIASTATADKNRLDTGTLGFSDINNKADFKTEHQGAGISTGGSIGGQFAGNMANALLAGGGNSGHAEGTTQAAVSEGSLIIRDKESQKQDVADLSRDAEHANGSISPIFDKEKEQQRLQEVQLIGEIGSQAVDIANTQGEINGLNAGRKELADKGITEPGADASDEAKAAYQDALRGTDAYKTTTAKYGTGSDLQRGIQAVTAALQGLAGSDLTAALAGASAPELAYRIGHGMGIDDNTAAKTIAHAILGGAVAALQGNSAAAGAAGAATGELAAKAIAGMLYPDVKDLSTLSEEQKQTVSALATISAGMAGGLAGNSTGSSMAGGQAGKNAVENNSLSKNKPPVNIFDINQLKPNALDADGDPLKGGGGNSGSAYNPTGRSGNPMNTKGSNSPAVIGERTYSAHAVDRMQGRGVPPSAVENTIKAGVTYPTNSGTTGYYDSTNNLRVIINSKTGDVVTVIPGAPTK
ncbi:TPA: VENN motif pre-toxin domain-containing protein, partial [Enterobacter mori]|nr:VENN motif pre-toxin domain-containing protein [Enterobacter mori]